MVRHQVLVLAFGGSNPSALAIFVLITSLIITFLNSETTIDFTVRINRLEINDALLLQELYAPL